MTIFFSGLRQQLDHIDEVIGEKGANATDYIAFLAGYYPTAHFQKLDQHIRSKTEAKTFENATNVNEYIELLEASLKIDRYSIYHKASAELLFVYMTFVNNPDFFDNTEQLIKVDQLTSKFSDVWIHFFVGKETYR